MNDHMDISDGEFSTEAVVNFFLKLAKLEESTITNIKMQKLLYFAQGFYLAFIKKPLIKSEFCAWSYGPVIPDLYHCLKEYGANPITENLPSNDTISDSHRAAQIIRDVWSSFGKMSVTRLVDISHKAGSPWSKVRSNDGYLKPIPNKLIEEYFSNLVS